MVAFVGGSMVVVVVSRWWWWGKGGCVLLLGDGGDNCGDGRDSDGGDGVVVAVIMPSPSPPPPSLAAFLYKSWWFYLHLSLLPYFYHLSSPQEGHRQAMFWGGGVRFQQASSSNTKQEPTIDLERFTMIFRYLSPWGFGEHAKTIAMRAFKVRWVRSVSYCGLGAFKAFKGWAIYR